MASPRNKNSEYYARMSMLIDLICADLSKLQITRKILIPKQKPREEIEQKTLPPLVAKAAPPKSGHKLFDPAKLTSLPVIRDRSKLSNRRGTK